MDSADIPSTSTSLAFYRGRKSGNPDYKFHERLLIIQYLSDQKYLFRIPSGTLKQDHTKARHADCSSVKPCEMVKHREESAVVHVGLLERKVAELARDVKDATDRSSGIGRGGPPIAIQGHSSRH